VISAAQISSRSSMGERIIQSAGRVTTENLVRSSEKCVSGCSTAYRPHERDLVFSFET
jgi:hypothetical protein